MESREVPEPNRVPIPRWVTPLLAATAIALVPWTLWLTFSLPARHVSEHYDLAWVGFDVALFAAFVATSSSSSRVTRFRSSTSARTMPRACSESLALLPRTRAGSSRMSSSIASAIRSLPRAAMRSRASPLASLLAALLRGRLRRSRGDGIHELRGGLGGERLLGLRERDRSRVGSPAAAALQGVASAVAVRAARDLLPL